ncbi:hypothetical protein ACFX16_032443 [Malus domestica]
MLRKTPDGLLLKCLGLEESMRVIAKLHKGIYGEHQAGTKIRWLLRRYGCFWSDMEKYCKAYTLEDVKNAKDIDLSNMCPQYP